jgi:RNA polymerase sigma factor (sigma-70 family)
LAFEEIYTLHSALVYNVALQYVQNVEDAQEITQDVFVTIHHKLSSFQHNSSLKTWIYRIAVNSSLDFIKARNRQKRRFLFNALRIDDEDQNINPAHFDHPGVALEQKEAMEQIFKAINCLPDRQKTAVILLKIEHTSMAEAAEIMEISPKALESLFQRAKKKLENILSNNEA